RFRTSGSRSAPRATTSAGGAGPRYGLRSERAEQKPQEGGPESNDPGNPEGPIEPVTCNRPYSARVYTTNRWIEPVTGRGIQRFAAQTRIRSGRLQVTGSLGSRREVVGCRAQSLRRAAASRFRPRRPDTRKYLFCRASVLAGLLK